LKVSSSTFIHRVVMEICIIFAFESDNTLVPCSYWKSLNITLSFDIIVCLSYYYDDGLICSGVSVSVNDSACGGSGTISIKSANVTGDAQV
jgi:hypothetical protein